MRRYAIVEKAKDADVIGILVGTLGVGAPLASYPADFELTFFAQQPLIFPSSPTSAN